MKGGDFSEIPAVIYDPISAPAGAQRMPFPNNRIPSTRFDQPSALMFSLLPPPNQAGAFNYVKVIGTKNDADAFDIRADYYATRRDRLAAVVTFLTQETFTEPIFERISGHALPNVSTLNNRTASLNWTRMIGPSAVNELIVGLKRDAARGPLTEGMQYEPDAGIRYLNTDPNDEFSTGFPAYIIPGYARFGGPAGGPYAQIVID
jgi:hypothetical protein